MASLLSSSSSSLASSLSSSLTTSSHSTAGHFPTSTSSVTAAVALVVAGCCAFFVIACCCLIFQLTRPVRLDAVHHTHIQSGQSTDASSPHAHVLLQLAHLQLFTRALPTSVGRDGLSAAVEPVGLSQEQLDALPDAVWQQSDVRPEDAEKERCSVCLEDYELNVSVVSKVRCGHVYHRECIRQWLSHNPACPLCLTTLTS